MENSRFSWFIGTIVLIVIMALLQPHWFMNIKSYIPSLLGLIMFGIGLTLQSHEFKQVYKLKWQITMLIILKYILLPLFALCLVKLFNLSDTDLIGLILVSVAPGGTSAAIMSFLARANVALTIVLTFVTTIVAPLLMPALVYIYLHKYITISFHEMATSIFWIVLFPLSDGLILRRILGERRIASILPIVPIISMCAVLLIIACVVSLNQQRILHLPLLLLLAILILNLGGITIGYFTARFILRYSHTSALAVGFEFGLQDSGLAVVLATKFFGIASALAGALFSVIQNITGPLMVNVSGRIRCLLK